MLYLYSLGNRSPFLSPKINESVWSADDTASVISYTESQKFLVHEIAKDNSQFTTGTGKPFSLWLINMAENRFITSFT